MFRLKSFYFSLLNLIALVALWPQAKKSPLSYGIFAALAAVLFALTFLIAAGKRHEGSQQNAWALMWRRLSRNKNAIAGLIVLTIFLYAAILAPFLAPRDPLEIDWGALSQGISPEHWLGTDDLGRDIFARTLFGARIAIGIGISAVVLNTLFGASLGLLAGFYGGKMDNFIMRLLEAWNAIPFILLAIAIMAAMGTGIGKLIILVSLSNLMAFARMIRGSVLIVKEAEYITAAKALGVPESQIALRHVLPNCISPILVLASLSIGETILVIAGLSFLGLGIQPPMPSLGAMLANGQQFLHENILMAFVPGAAIFLLVLSFNLFGDGVRDALDTKLTD